jgi:hypothetical protein
VGILKHSKSLTMGDAAGTITYWNGATTSSVAATNVMRPVDWNSAHVFTQSISGDAGNTFGTSTFSGTNLVYGFSGHLYGSASTEPNAATLWLGESDPGAYTAWTYQNRQLAASVQMTAGQNSLWLVPFRVAAPISGSSLLMMQSFTGTVTSATSGSYYQTVDAAIYSQNAGTTARFDTLWSSRITANFHLDSTASVGWAFNGGGSSGNNSTMFTNEVWGLRNITANINATIDTGLYLFGLRWSTAASGYASFVRTNGIVFDSPMNVGMGLFNSAATNASIGFADAGTWTSQTTNNIPASVSIDHIKQASNLAPYFKIGAL